MNFRSKIFFLVFLIASFVNAKKAPIDLKDYKLPLFDQMKNRIREKIIVKLGNKTPEKERFFLIPYAYQDESDQAEQSHTFVTVVCVGRDCMKRDFDIDYLDDKKDAKAFTISWLPDRFRYDPTLYVFSPGLAAILFASKNKVTYEKGHNFSLKETLAFALKPEPKNDGKKPPKFTREVGMWGPYEITKEYFEKAIERRSYLKHGNPKYGNPKYPEYAKFPKQPQYIADDRLWRENLIAFNCYHAVMDLHLGFPLGGFLDTGLKMWGVNGTKHTLEEYKAKVPKWFLDPINTDDVYGFVYVENPADAKKVHNPFPNSSAYFQ